MPHRFEKNLWGFFLGQGGIGLTTSDMVRELCEKMNISIAELSRRIGQTPQNFSKKLKRETVSFEEMMSIAGVVNVKYVQIFILPDGEKIGFY